MQLPTTYFIPDFQILERSRDYEFESNYSEDAKQYEFDEDLGGCYQYFP